MLGYVKKQVTVFVTTPRSHDKHVSQACLYRNYKKVSLNVHFFTHVRALCSFAVAFVHAETLAPWNQ